MDGQMDGWMEPKKERCQREEGTIGYCDAVVLIGLVSIVIVINS
jgi:hypothetical protein